jgi:acetyltransferase-like isoleucine patch superfamily enzyme
MDKKYNSLKIKFILNRLLYMPIGLLYHCIKIANIAARNIENKKRFKHAQINDGCCIDSTTHIGTHSHILNNCIINNSNIGNYTYIGNNSIIQNTTIGNYCSISYNIICGLGSHPLNLFSTSPLFYRKKNTFKLEVVEKDYNFQEYRPIIIGNDVWIGARAIIMDGIHIGNGAVIAAGAIVTKDIPDYAIVGGVPAKVLKYRTIPTSKKTTDSWWNLSPQEAYHSMNSNQSI